MMKKYIITIIPLLASLLVEAQSLNTLPVNSWDNMRLSGFYESITAQTPNLPNKNVDYYWGINIAHTGNKNTGDKPYHWGGQMLFEINRNNQPPVMYIRSTNVSGNGIWAKVITNKGDHEIAGRLKAREISIEITAGADHVFGESYNLKPLYELEQFVKTNNHLPEIPSEKQMQAEGLSINEFQIKLLQKIEELTLYTIELKKEIDQLKAQNQ